MRPLYIFDLDGTLALNGHRHHHIKGPKKDWDAFNQACDKDLPNLPVIAVFQALKRAGAECQIWSGRGNEVREKTVDWISWHVLANDDLTWHAERHLKMRPERDYTEDSAMKRAWLEELTKEDRARLTAIFDDRDRVVRMWRQLGLVCFQVAEGDF